MKILIVLLALICFTNCQAQSLWLHERLDLPSLTKLNSISVANDSDYVLSFDGFGDCGIVRTTDAGKHWNEVMRSSDGLMGINDVAHPSPNVIIASIDSTFSWQRNNATVIAAAGSLITSTDAGQNWTRKTFGVKGDTNRAFDTRLIRMFNATDGVATLTLNSLQCTTNGGLTWQSMPSPQPYMYYVYAMDVADNATIVLCEYAESLHDRRMFRTTNMGKTWDSSATPAPWMRDLDMVNSTIGYATGNEIINGNYVGHIYKTTDGGLSWLSIFDTAYGAGDPLVCLAFKDQNNGFVFGRDGLIMGTTNGGLSWQLDHVEYSLGVDMGAYFDATYITPQKVIAVGGDGCMVTLQPRSLLPWPELLVPSYGVAVTKTFQAKWKHSEGAERYEMRLITNTFDKDTIYLENDLTDTTYDFNQLKNNSYFLEVRAVSADNFSNWSRVLFSTLGTADIAIPSPNTFRYGLFPNPISSTTLTITGIRSRTSVIVTDILGNETIRTWLDESNNQLDLNGLRPGVYAIELSAREARETLKLIRQ